MLLETGFDFLARGNVMYGYITRFVVKLLPATSDAPHSLGSGKK